MKALLYCCKFKKKGFYFWKHNDEFDITFVEYKPSEYRTQRLKGSSLDGTICGLCYIDQVEEIVYDGDGEYQPNTFKTKTLTEHELMSKAKLGLGSMIDYFPRYALSLSNVKAIKPFGIGDCFSPFDKDFHELKQAPQNMQIVLVGNGNEDIDSSNYLLISIRPEYLCKILNGDKTIEVRRAIPNELKRMIK